MFADEFVERPTEERRSMLAKAGRTGREGLPADVLAWLAEADEEIVAVHGEATEPVLVDMRTEKKAG